MDMLPDYEIPETPKGFRYAGFRTPKIGDWMVDYYGKPYLITAANKEYVFEHHPVYIKIGKANEEKL